MDTNIKEKIIHELETLPVCLKQGSRQYVVRCPYCGDSHNLSHGHFSIRIDPTDPTDPLLYRCFKCENSGLFTIDTMRDLGLYVDNEVSKGLSKLIYRSCKINKITDIKTEDYQVPGVNYERKITGEKIDYLEKRLGVEFSSMLLHDLNVIINLDEFIIMNKVPLRQDLRYKYVEFLTKNYVGFLSKNKNLIVLRCIRNDPDMPRYRKVIINPSNFDTNTFYGIPNKLDIMYTNEINVYIAEGTFDILGVYMNIMDKKMDNNYYYAACGFGIQSVLRNIIRMGINTGLNVHIYADKDKSDKEITKLIRNYYPWLNSLTIHRNGSGSKDFGVPKDMIIDTSVKYKVK